MRRKYNQGTAFWFPNCIWQWRLFVLLSRRTWRRVCQSTRHHSWQRENLPPPCGWKNSCRQSFVGKTGAKEAIYSYGHRNPQGLAKHPTTGAIWDQEHGPKGGDEINIIKKVLIMDGPLWPTVSIMMARPLATKPKSQELKTHLLLGSFYRSLRNDLCNKWYLPNWKGHLL
jgi:hypothetical protein